MPGPTERATALPADSANDEATPGAEPRPRHRPPSGIWPRLVAVLVTALVLLIPVTQCVPHVPNIVGLSQDQAASRLKAAGYLVGTVKRAVVTQAPVGTVALQSPAAGAIFATGRPVDFVVALGAEKVQVPDLMGADSPGASVQLSAKQLEMDVAGQYSSRIPAGAVMSQNPVPGTEVRVKSTVALVVSLGIEPETASGTGSTAGAGTYYSSKGGTTGSSGDGTTASTCNDSYSGASVWESGGDIFARLSPGAGARQLTSGSPWDTNPMLAPSAKYVVFMRAPSSGGSPTGVGWVCLTDFDVAMLTMPTSKPLSPSTVTYGLPAFAPSPTGTVPDSDWIVTPQYPTAEAVGGHARLLVTNVPQGSTWVSNNDMFRPIPGAKMSQSSKPGCVKVTLPGSGGVRHFNAYAGTYTP